MGLETKFLPSPNKTEVPQLPGPHAVAVQVGNTKALLGTHQLHLAPKGLTQPPTDQPLHR
ncbi:MAG: hypothetical protein RLZZ158_765 [Cyanobacteriota bacterium]|jgi:hypothetical protein